MENSLIFTGLILLAGLAGGLIGNACGKGRRAQDCEKKLADMEQRLEELEFLVGETPTGGLLGRVGVLEDKVRKEAQGGC